MTGKAEPLIALILEDILTDHNATCIGSAASIGAVLEMLTLHGFDNALLDVDMRGGRIDPVADRLAAAGIPFVFTTSHGESAWSAGHHHRPMVMKRYSVGGIINFLVQLRPQVGG